MGFLIFVFIICLIFIGGGWLLGNSIGEIFEKSISKREEEEDIKSTYIDNSVHFHVHNNQHDYGDKITNNQNLHQNNLTVIDEETHKKAMEYFNDKEYDNNK